MKIDTIAHTLDRAALAVGGVACAGIVGMMVCGIASRSLRLPLFFADEYGGYLMAAVAFLGLAEVTRRREHIFADYPSNQLPPRTQSALRAAADALLIVYSALLLWFAGGLAITSYVDGLRSQGLMNTPLWLPQSVMVVGLALMVIRAVLMLVASLTALLRPAGVEKARA